MIIFVFVALFLYGGLNYYIGLRGWQNVGNFIPFLSIRVYWFFFWFTALSYIAGRLGSKFLPDFIGRNLTVIGSYWMAAMLYFTLILVTVDLVRLIDKHTSFLPQSIRQNPHIAPFTGFIILFLVAGILIFGSWNARNPQIKHYDINIQKSAGPVQQLHAVMVSDIHLGNIINNGRLTRMVEMVNGLNPDVVLLVGDVIDEDVGPFVEQNMAETFRQLKSRFGVFAVLGNHEYIGRNAETAVHYLEGAGVRVLRDNWVKVIDSFYIVGRDDLSSEQFQGKPRKKIPEIMNGVDMALPVILMDHQPSSIEESRNYGIDLQLSGHTHRGQMFPNELITNKIYEVDWGYMKKENFQVIVSSGFGTWGPPIRIGNAPEVVDITIHFGN